MQYTQDIANTFRSSYNHSHAGPTMDDLNSLINTYYENKVKMNRDNTKSSISITIPIVEKLLKYINEKDPRFSKSPSHDGSYYAGLKVNRADEFDLNIPLCATDKFNGWKNGHDRYYQLDDRNVTSSSIPLPPPEKGYCVISLLWNSYPIWHNCTDLVFNKDIIPYLVKQRFKRLLSDAIRDLNFQDKIKMHKWIHGPAITIIITSNDHHDISIDFAPLYEGAGLQVPPYIQWPHPNASWPSREKIDKVRDIGVNFVAKKNFDWLISFAKMERELTNEIDNDDGCRKRCLRIIKKLREDHWCKERKKPAISSYHLKNILFWECEKHPSSNDWVKNMQADRLMSMIKLLDKSIDKCQLPQYFNPGVNLFKEKEWKDLKGAGVKVKEFIRNPREILIEILQ